MTDSFNEPFGGVDELDQAQMLGQAVVPTENDLAKNERLLKLAVIGTGNCGSMMANQAAKQLGLDTIAINGSTKDLDLAEFIPANCKFQVGDGNGTGKDRDRAKSFFIENSGLVMDSKVTSIIESNDVIFVCASTGGGYGSGSSTELLEVLNELYPEKIFIAVGVLPFVDEGYAAFNGTKDWLREVLNLHIRYMLYVNEMPTNKKTRESVAINVNNKFVEHLTVLQGDWLGPTTIGGIDSRDMLTVLSTEGRIAVFTADDLEISAINDNLIQTLKNRVSESCNAELVNDGQLAASALMYTLGSEFNEHKATIKQDLIDTFGEHIKDMTNFTDEEGGSSIALVLSGLTEPTNVIDRIISKLQKAGDTIVNRKSATSKLDKFSGIDDAKLNVRAKHSFAIETQAVTAQTPSSSNKDELLQKFLSRKTALANQKK